MAFLRLVVIIILIVTAYRLVLKPLLRWLLTSMLKKFLNRQFGQFQNQQSGQNSDPNRKEGSIHIDYMPKQPGKPKKDPPKGDYIDYEEIK
ncbi:MAG: DUF4834 family protein [Cytophagaceae bacterium]|nr:DUF4834 family protein [Cytophagaceae bacterium]